MHGISIGKRKGVSSRQLRRRARRGAPSARGRSLRPAIEQLEERTLLSVQAPSLAADWSNLQVDPAHYDASSILVRFRPEADCNARGCNALSASGVLAGTSIGWASELVSGLAQVHLADGVSVEQALRAYRASPLVDYAEPDYQIQLSAVPNDPRFAEQWNLHNTGQSGGTVDADIDAPEAWEANTGSGGTIVAVIDTGVDYKHPDLMDNMWHNPAEIPNGKDDDGNGFIDDIYGADFVNGDGDPMDDNGHGTHVAGIIGAVGDNGIGVAGVNWHVQIMALKFMNGAGQGTTSNAIKALTYAVAHGATISNNSWGGPIDPIPSLLLYLAIAEAADAGHIFVAAAGNSHNDNDLAPSYPASYNLPNIISVAATDRNDHLASFSNFGPTTVDLAAPGVDILSTVPASGPISDPSGYAFERGTSMAAPHVTGVVALLRDLHPDWTSTQIINRTLASVDPLPDLQGKTFTGGRLNAAVAIDHEFSFGIGSVLPDIATGIATDSNGNVYVTGSFFNRDGADEPLDFDPVHDDPPAGTDFLRSRGGTDIFVAKYSRSGQFVWAKSMGGQSNDEALAIAVDDDGNVYTTGRFSGIADFNPSNPIPSGPVQGASNTAPIVITSPGHGLTSGTLVTVTDVKGNTAANGQFTITVLDGNQFALDGSVGNGDFLSSGIWLTSGTDDASNVFLLNSVGFDPDMSETQCRFMLQTAGFGDVLDAAALAPCRDTLRAISNEGTGAAFISKLDPDGHFVWARNVGGRLKDHGSLHGAVGNDLAVDANGVYLTGDFYSAADFDPGPNEHELGSIDIGVSQVFVLALTPAGNFRWAKELGQNTEATVQLKCAPAGAVQAASNTEPIVITSKQPHGLTTGTLVSVTGVEGNTNANGAFTITKRNERQFVLNGSRGNAPYQGGGTWQVGPSICNNTASGIAVAGSGDVFVTGTVNVQSGADHVFLSKFDRDGRMSWKDELLTSISGTRSLSAGIALDQHDNPVIAGTFSGSVDFDPGAGVMAPPNASGTDIFVARYRSDGTFDWVRAAGSLDDDQALAIATDRGSVYATGAFRGTVQFNPDAPNAPESRLTSSGADDVFVWQLNSEHGTFVDALAMGGKAVDAGTAIAVDRVGNILVTGIFADKGTFGREPNLKTIQSHGATDVFVAKIIGEPDPDPVLIPPPPPAPLPNRTQLAVFRSGLWFLDLDHAGTAAERAFAFGMPTDTPVLADWNGDGTSDAAVFRNGLWFFDLDGTGGAAERAFAFGMPGDLPVAGDFNGDGTADAAVFRNGIWFFDLDHAGGRAEAAFAFGMPGDVPVAYDWDGDGTSDAAVFRNGLWFFDLDHAGGAAERYLQFGLPGDLPVAGDFNGDRAADAAVFRRGTWFFDLDGHGGAGERAAAFGITGDSPLAGLWTAPAKGPITVLSASSIAASSVAPATLDDELESHGSPSPDASPLEPGSAVVAASRPTPPPHTQPNNQLEPAADTPSYADLVDDALLTLTDEYGDLALAGLFAAAG